MQTVVIAAFDGALASGLVGIADLLCLSQFGLIEAEDRVRQTKSWLPEVIFASYDGSPIKDGRGRTFPVDRAFKDITSCDAIIIPGFLPEIKNRLSLDLTNINERIWLTKQYRQGSLIGGSCSGVFVLGEAGLLEQRKCTTTWWLHYQLEQKFPQANAVWGSGLIMDERIITAGGPISWVDITLQVIRVLAGESAAKLIADFALVDTIPKSQMAYIPQNYLTKVDPFLVEAEHIVRNTLNKFLSTSDLAAAMMMSERTLHRRIKNLTGEAPKAFITRLRVESACILLQSSNSPINNIARTFGYEDEASFRRLFHQQMGMTPSAYRQRFNKLSSI